MDAHALLTSQGWRGSGHSLHPTTDSTGLSRPLLVSQKQNTLGIGKKQHRTSDMWWMNAFDKSLKGLDTSTEGKVVQTITSGALDMVAKGGGKYVGNTGGLYGCFVRGEVMGGTMDEEDATPTPEDVTPEPSSKRRRIGETKEERRARKDAKRAARAAAQALVKVVVIPTEEPESEASQNTETKEERRERRRQKKLLRQAVETSTEEASSKESTKRKKRRKE